MSYTTAVRRLFLSTALLLTLVPSAHALDADSEMIRNMARQLSRSMATSTVVASQVPLPARAIAPLAATLPAVFSASPAAVIDAAVMKPSLAPAAGPSKAFPMLATTYVALNVLDIYTTSRAVSTGRGAEANPLLGPIASTPVGLTAAKIATTATTLVIAKRLWKEHRTASIALMVAANIGTGFIVGHNATIAMR